jgi:hypothetical protein
MSYITLPSNSSSIQFPANRQSNYTTILNPPLVLNYPSEIALVDISYSPQISVNIGNISMKNPFYRIDQKWACREEFIDFKVNALNGISSEKFFKQLTTDLRKFIILKEYKVLWDLAFQPSEDQIDQIYKFHEHEKLLRLSDENKKHKSILITCAYKNVWGIIAPNDEYYNKLFDEAGGVFTAATRRFLFASIDNLKQNFNLI